MNWKPTPDGHSKSVRRVPARQTRLPLPVQGISEAIRKNTSEPITLRFTS